MFRFVFLLAIFASAQSQIILDNCLDVEVVNDFDASQYVGVWYEYQKYPTLFELDAKCVTATYTAMPDGSIGVYNENIDKITGEHKSINGSATFDGPSNVAKLSVSFTTGGGKGTYWVLGTDYENYAVVWSCNTRVGLNVAFSWVLTREAEPSEETLQKAQAVIEKNNLFQRFFVKTEQKDCNRKQ